jgi:septum formation protein
VAHEVIPPDVDEREQPGEPPAAMAVRLAREKALAVARRLGAGTPRWVLGADTIVVLEDRVLGKPADAADARRMLGRLTGRWHRVVTGVAVVHSGSERSWTLAVTSEVRMRAASPEEIEAYVATGEPLDKAGSYGIQGEGGRRFVSRVEGSESNVMGLPVEQTLDLLERAAREHTAGTETKGP